MFSFVSGFARSMARLRLSRKELEARRLRKLREVLAFAGDHVPMYKKLHGDAGPEIRHLSDLRQVPVLSPDYLRSQDLEEITPPHLSTSNLTLHGTSGSTGKPFRFYESREDVNAWYAAVLRFFLISGWRPWWPTAVVWREASTKTSGWIQRLIEKRKNQISIHWPLETQAHRLLSQKPRMIYGMSSALDILATWMIENDRTVGSADLVVGQGEAISDDMAQRFKAAFGHEGLNFYGANECGFLGWECRQCGLYHFEEDSFIFEVVDEKLDPVGPGEQGKLLITCLNRAVLPLIRYEIGDLITLPAEPARECKIPFRQFASVNGRLVDRLVLKNGQEMSWLHVFSVTMLIESIKRIQFGQQKDGEVIVRYVPKDGFNPEDIERHIIAQLQITENADLVFQQCSDIPLEESGKFKLIKREV